jgi:hypothetical protein
VAHVRTIKNLAPALLLHGDVATVCDRRWLIMSVGM